jgi:TRAP transporter TAXI family solute receptor
MNRRHTLLGGVALLAGLPALDAAAQQRELTWSAGQPTGGWYLQAAAIAKLIKDKEPSLVLRPVAGAAYENMSRLERGETAFAWSLPPVITAAYSGAAPYTAAQSDVRLVMTGLGFVDTQFCIAADSPIRSVREIFEKKLPIRIGSPRPGGSDEWELRKIFEFYKMSYDDLKLRGGRLVFGSFSELATQYGQGSLDAFILNNAVPADDVVQAAALRKMRILPMDDDLLAYLERFGMSRTIIAEGSYKNVSNNDLGIATAAMANTIVTSAKVPEAIIHDFTKLLLDNLAALRALHPAFADFDPADATTLADVPLHPGAERAYREAGLLK